MLEYYPDVLSVRDLMEILGCGKASCYFLLHNGIIPSFRVGNRFKVSKESVLEYIRSGSHLLPKGSFR